MTRFRRYVRKRYHKPSLGLKAFNSIEEAAALRSRDSDLSEDLAKLVVTRGLKKVESGLQWSSDPRLLYQTLRPHTEENIRSILREIQAPVLLAVSRKNRKAWREYLDPRMACVPLLETVMLDGGHHLHMEHPALLADMIRSHILS